ncbi:MAG: hypothetical protein WCF65_02025 [Parachlamydiaceae bacterium]
MISINRECEWIMEINRRALYNSLRMNWILQPTAEVEAWQVEDYRAMPTDGLFERLEDRHIRLDKSSFAAFADAVDTPEELTDTLVGEMPEDMRSYDQIYLVVFELWRRLLPEKTCLSIFCDELDHQISLYDQGHISLVESIEDALANLRVILDENTDEGADPHDAFDCINGGCANDIETFLHDFISEQIDNSNELYASELIEGFTVYIHDVKWFDFLRARVISSTDTAEANRIIKQLLSRKNALSDLEFNLEVLSFLVAYGDKETFDNLVKKSIPLLEVEEDFNSLLSIGVDFYHRLDKESVEMALERILRERQNRDPNGAINPQDSHFSELLRILSQV